MSLRATIAVRRGPLDLRLDLEVATGEVVALLGPNAAGKTTALDVVAGLLAADEARVELDSDVLDDTAAGVHVPTESRPIGYVFQQHLLFAHLSLLENVAFGLRSRGMARAEARRRAHSWLERMGLADRAGDRPGSLSGGQAQRVALARALATDPRLLLLDEPLAALDASTRAEVRTELRHHLAAFEGTRLLVTHDPLDAMLLADRLVIIEDGRQVQSGTPAEVSRRPRSPYVATLVGLNLLAGRGDGVVVRLPTGGTVHVADKVAGDVLLAVRPQAVALHRTQPGGSPRNAWSLTVTGIEAAGDRVRVALDGQVPLVAEVTAAAVSELGLEPGAEIWAAVKATEIEAYPA